MTAADWGVANGGEHTVAEKRAARAGQDVPELLERQLRRALGAAMEWSTVREAWQAGLVDLKWDAGEGEAYASMTLEQSALFMQARGLGS